ncbi:hypothetical protein [Roseivivax sp. CAU 1753]
MQRLIDCLRQIYFTPAGVLALLREIESGRYPSENKIATVLPEFNDREFHVGRARHDLDRAADLVRGNLSLRANRVLGEISYGKAGIRQKVKDLLNEALTFEGNISREQASELIGEIRTLNDAIEEAEEKLIASMR